MVYLKSDKIDASFFPYTCPARAKIEVSGALWYVDSQEIEGDINGNSLVSSKLTYISDIVRVGPFKKGEKVRHNKTGGEYRIISTPENLKIEKGYISAYAYQSLNSPYIIFVRPADEMEDGRFKRLP